MGKIPTPLTDAAEQFMLWETFIPGTRYGDARQVRTKKRGFVYSDLARKLETENHKLRQLLQNHGIDADIDNTEQ